MTNEPPTGDGEERVEADPAGGTEPTSASAPDPSSSTPVETPESGEAAESELPPDAAADGATSGDLVWRDPSSGLPLSEDVQALVRLEDKKTIDNNQEDSAIEDLDKTVLPQLIVGQPEVPADDADAEDLVEADLPGSGAGSDGSEELVEADLPGWSETVDEAVEPATSATEEEAEASHAEPGAAVFSDAELAALRQQISHIYLTPEPFEDGEAELDPALSTKTPALDDLREQFEQELSEGAESTTSDVSTSSGGLFSVSPSMILGGVAAAAAIAVVAVVGSSLFDGSEDDGATQLPADSATTAEPGTAATAAAGATDPTTAPATPAPVAASTDPADHWVVVGSEALSDTNGDLSVALTFKNPWGAEPPTTGYTAAAQISAGVEVDGRFYGTLWSISAGIGSYAEALAGGTEFPRTSQQQPLVEPELWLTDDGRLVIRLPGPSPTGGMPVALLSPDSSLLVGGQTWISVRGDPTGTINNVPLGPITDGGTLPLTSWHVAVPDLDTITLTVPDTSNQN